MLFRGKINGFGIIEILLALAISILLCIGFLSLIGNKMNDTQLDKSLSELQRKGQFTQNYLSRASKLSSYQTSSNLIENETFDKFPKLIPTHAQILNATNASMNGSDTISVSYVVMKDSSYFDCMAVPLIPNQLAQSMFFVNESAELACCPIDKGTPNVQNIDVLIEGVEAMRIRYGEDTDNDGIVNRYVAADFPELSLSRVINVKISLLLRTPENASPIFDTKYYTLQDVELGPFNDHILRKVYTTIIPIKGLHSSSLKELSMSEMQSARGTP